MNDNISQSAYNEGINNIKEIINQISDRISQQKDTIDQIVKQNQNISSCIDEINQKIEFILNNSNKQKHPDVPELNEESSSFDLSKQIVTINGKNYSYNCEQMCSDIQSLRSAYDSFNDRKKQDKFPQGAKYVESLLSSQLREGTGNIIILSDTNHPPSTTYFYFLLKSFKELDFSQGDRVMTTSIYQKQINEFEEYKSDNYPQGRAYCERVLHEQCGVNLCPYILARQGDSGWTRYYFKSRCIRIQNNEDICILKGRSQLKKELNLIRKSGEEEFPQGIDHCCEVVGEMIKTNGEVMRINAFSEVNNVDNWLYFRVEEIQFACNEECRVRGRSSLMNEISVIHEREKYPRNSFPQGIEQCLRIIEEQIECRGTVHIMRRKSIKNFWFYFKD